MSLSQFLTHPSVHSKIMSSWLTNSHGFEIKKKKLVNLIKLGIYININNIDCKIFNKKIIKLDGKVKHFVVLDNMTGLNLQMAIFSKCQLLEN